MPNGEVKDGPHADGRLTAGLRIFFPAYKDSGTIASLVIAAIRTARRLTPDYEVSVVNDGSADDTHAILDELARLYPEVRIVTHGKNRGYGAALRSGFDTASRELVFYTDGDAQYDPAEVETLWKRSVFQFPEALVHSNRCDETLDCTRDQA